MISYLISLIGFSISLGRKELISFCFSCIAFSALSQVAGHTDQHRFLIIDTVATLSLQDFPPNQLSNSILGTDGNTLFIAGGTDYSLKDDTLTVASDQWNDRLVVFKKDDQGRFTKQGKTFKLPFDPIAFAGVVPTKSGLVCISGLSANGMRQDVFLINWNQDRDSINYQTLPSLPVGAVFRSGISTDEQLYIIGSSAIDTKSNYLFSIDLQESSSTKTWKERSRLSHELGASPILSIQSDGLRDCLYLFEDYSAIRKMSSLREVHKFDFKTEAWQLYSSSSSIPFSTWLNGSSKALGSADIMSIAEAADTSFYQVLFYHTVTNTFRSIASISNGESIIAIPSLGSTAMLIRFPKRDIDSTMANLVSLEVVAPIQQLSRLNILILVFYFLLLLLLGFYFSGKQSTTEDYFKGGKRIPWWAAGLSLYGTGLSAISFMAVPAKTYVTDWAYFMTKLPLLLIPIIVSALFIPFYRKLDITSAYEYLQKRFNLGTRLIGSLSFIIFQLGRIGIILYLPAIALNIVTGIDIVLCILLMGGISLVYTMMGGIEAVIWTDVLQVIVLVGGIILCLILISMNIDGGMKKVISIGLENDKFELFNMAFDWQQPTFWVVVLSGFFSNLITYSTDQTMVQRYLTTKDTEAAKKSIWTYTLVSLSIGWIFFFVGTALYSYYKSYPSALLPNMSTNDAIFPWYIISQLPDGVSGLLIAGIFAAAMSSLSSSMNSGATAYTVDFHRNFKWKGDELFVGRAATFIIGALGISFALLFATMEIKSIWDEFLKIIGLIAGGLGGVFLLGIVSTRANGMGALIGLLGSGVVQFLMATYQPIHFLLYTASGFLSCLILGYLASFLFPYSNKPIDGLTIYTISSSKRAD